MITKQSIHQEFEREFVKNADTSLSKMSSFPVLTVRRPEKIKSFYDTQIQKLLEEIVPSGVVGGNEFSNGPAMGFNQAIAEIKNKIKEAGY